MRKIGFMKNDLEKMRAPGIRPLFLLGILAAASMAAFAWADAAAGG